MSLLTIIQDAADLLSLPKPDQVIGNDDPDVQKLLTIANVEGDDLRNRGPWQQLEAEAVFSSNLGTVNGRTTEFDLEQVAPGWDWQRNPTFWDRTGKNLVNGPITPAEAQTNVAYIPTNVYYEWRVLGDKISIYPNIPSEIELAFEYVSRFWCRSNGGTKQDRWRADTDVGILPEFLMVLGVEWRYNQRAGFDMKWPEQKRNYDGLVQKQIASGVQGRAIDLTGQDSFRKRRVPYGDWPQYNL